MVGNREINKVRLDNLGTWVSSDKVLALKPDGTIVSTGLTIADISTGIPLESDNINDADPNVNKFVAQADLDKLGNIAVTGPIDLDFRQAQLIELADADYVAEMELEIDF